METFRDFEISLKRILGSCARSRPLLMTHVKSWYAGRECMRFYETSHVRLLTYSLGTYTYSYKFITIKNKHTI